MDRLLELAGLILKEAKDRGADSAQCRVAEREKKEFNAESGRFTLMRTLFDRDVSITVLKDRRRGVVRINRFEEKAVRAAVADCLTAAAGAEPDPAWEFAGGPARADFCDGAAACDTEALFARTDELLNDIKQKHNKIVIEQAITSHNVSRSVYANTNDVVYTRTAGSYDFSLMYSAHEGEKASSFYSSDVTLARLDRPVIGCAMIDRELGAVERQVDTRPLGGKFTGPVVLAPGALLEIVLGTIYANFVSDSSLIDGTSIWKDKLGERVADPSLSVLFRPDSADVVAGERYTSEGYLSENDDVIRDGVLRGFCLSQYGANKTGGKRFGCGGWNVFVPAGERSLEEIVGGIEKGVLVMRFSGGQPSPGGEFSGVAKNSFLIENGRIGPALTETMISGCVPEMLNRIRGISREVLRDGTMSLPYIAFDGVTISGNS